MGWSGPGGRIPASDNRCYVNSAGWLEDEVASSRLSILLLGREPSPDRQAQRPRRPRPRRPRRAMGYRPVGSYPPGDPAGVCRGRAPAATLAAVCACRHERRRPACARQQAAYQGARGHEGRGVAERRAGCGSGLSFGHGCRRATGRGGRLEDRTAGSVFTVSWGASTRQAPPAANWP